MKEMWALCQAYCYARFKNDADCMFNESEAAKIKPDANATDWNTTTNAETLKSIIQTRNQDHARAADTQIVVEKSGRDGQGSFSLLQDYAKALKEDDFMLHLRKGGYPGWKQYSCAQ